MIICPNCFAVNKNKKLICLKCGNSIHGIPDEINRENIWRWRAKQRLFGHMMSGVLVCFGLTLIFGPPFILGLRVFFTNLIISVFFGLMLGYLVSRFSRSMWSAMAIGTGIGIAYFIINVVINFDHFTIMHAYSCFSMGLIPGVIMGLVVGMDEYL